MGNCNRAGNSCTSSTPVSKIFSGASTAYGAEPNTQACLVDLGMPGPVAGAQRGGRGQGREVWPGYRLKSGAPLGVRPQELFLSGPAQGLPDQSVRAAYRGDGKLEIVLEDGSTKIVGLTRAHLEEDAGKSLHEDFAGMTGIDLNRAGTPLLEIVSEPEMRNAKEAVAYMKTIHTLVRYLDISDGNMAGGLLPL